MSDTASSPVDRWLFPGWVIFAAANTAMMFGLPGQETIPFHFVYISMALVYGFQPWPLRRTFVILGLVAVTTGAALVWHVKNDVIGWEETAEIPLMALLFLVMVWHVRRRRGDEGGATLCGERTRDAGDAEEVRPFRIS